jgi:hypothetical protein
MGRLTGSKELLTAGSKEYTASSGLLPGQTTLTTGAPGHRSYDSFTRVLIRELEAALQDAEPFTTRTLHMRLDMRDEFGKRRLEHQPQLFTLAPSDDAIMLFPVPKIKAPISQAPSMGWILLSVQISGSPPGDQPQGTDWLEYINTSVSEGFREQVEIAAAFISNSTVLILSMPTDVWAFLPHDFTGSYIGQVKSGNLLLEQETMNGRQSVLTSTPITVSQVRNFPYERLSRQDTRKRRADGELVASSATNNVSPRQSLFQAPRYSSQTMPNPSISALPHRLNEDFENFGMTQPHEELLGFGGDENDLAHVGTINQFLTSESHNANIGTSQEQAPDLHEDHQMEQGSSTPAADIRKFLEKHFPNDSLNLPTLATQETLQSLQSASLIEDPSNTSLSASILDTNSFKTSIKDGKLIFHCSYPGCKRTTLRKCELRIHLKRHTLPWACTVDKCLKAFGSKNDWIRHESKQHEQQECWRCGETDSNKSGESMPASSTDACMRVFYTKDLYSEHLRQVHKFHNNNVIDEMCDKQRIGRKARVQFWCGFCKRVIPLKQIGVSGESERYSHIDYHFSKEKCNIEQWELLNGRLFEEESALAAEQTSSTESSSSVSHEEEAQSTAIQRGSRKRPSSTMVNSNQGPAPKRAYTVRTEMVRCCQCANVFQPWNGVCIPCNHRLCRNCAAEVIEQTD